jgi:hypothetical protein
LHAMHFFEWYINIQELGQRWGPLSILDPTLPTLWVLV